MTPAIVVLVLVLLVASFALGAPKARFGTISDERTANIEGLLAIVVVACLLGLAVIWGTR